MNDWNFMMKLIQTLWKKGWLQLLLEKNNILNKKKIDPNVPGIKYSNLKRKNFFFRNNYLNHHSFFDLVFC